MTTKTVALALTAAFDDPVGRQLRGTLIGPLNSTSACWSVFSSRSASSYQAQAWCRWNRV
jgi:hypothetical protein